MLVFELADPGGRPGGRSSSTCSAATLPALVATHPAGRRELLCAVVDPGSGDPVELAAGAREALEASYGPVRAAASRSLPAERVRHSFHEARCALEATAFANGAAPEVASHRDLGAFTLLLSVQDGEALRLYCDSVLGPIENSDERYAAELLRSLEAYIERNGHWERAASDCYCHRHTLRYRIKRIEDLTGRDLSRANDRVEMWLALRARGADRVRVAVLGAGGTIAPAIVRDLAESEEVVALRLLDLDLRRAEAVAIEHGGGKAEAREADATAGLAEQLAGIEVLVNSASYRINLAAMEACLEAGCHYIDLGGLYHVTKQQLELSPRFEQRGLIAMLGRRARPPARPTCWRLARSATSAARRTRSRSSPPGATSNPPEGSPSPTRCRPCWTRSRCRRWR